VWFCSLIVRETGRIGAKIMARTKKYTLEVGFKEQLRHYDGTMAQEKWKHSTSRYHFNCIIVLYGTVAALDVHRAK
jgi:hypothetical protein